MQDLLDIIIPDDVNEEIKNIKIKYLSNIIPNRLMNKLISINCESIQDIINIDMNWFKSLDSIGTNTLSDLKGFHNTILNNPKSVIEAYNSNKEIILPSNITKSFLADFENIIEEYFTLINDLKAKDIIYKRFGLFNNTRYTLEDLGLFYGITRERIRQIQNIHLNKFRELINGNNLKKPYCILDKSFIDNHSLLKKEIEKYNLISEQQIINICDDFNITINDDNKKNILNLYLELLGIKDYRYNGLNYYINNDSIKQKHFESACDSVLSILQDEVIAIDLFDIVIKVRKKNKNINKDIIEHILKFLPEIEEIEDLTTKKYQIKFSKLRSFKDYAYRILYEKQEIMHSLQIWREIQHRLVLENEKTRDSERSLKGQLVADSRFTPIGRTGNWSLSTWKHDSSSIIELIIKAIHHYNKPCDIKDISKYINEIRPQIKQHSIYSILSQHKDKFMKLEDNTLILREWTSTYPDASEIGESEERITMDNFCNILAEINLKNPGKEFTLKELQEELKEFNIFWKESYCHVKFNSCNILNKRIESNRALYLIDSNYTKQTHETTSKLEQLKINIIKHISEVGNGILPLKIVADVAVKNGELRPNVYTVISKNPDVFSKYNKKKIHYVELIGKQIENKIEKEINTNIENIKNGENNYIEFKSTLRWDLREEKINKEMNYMVIKAITAFLNTEGGILYIGVADDSEILGLDKDYNTFSKKNRDGFLLFLNDLLINYFSKKIFTFVEANIEEINGKDIAIIRVKKSSSPVFITEKKEKFFYIRGSASVQKLDLEETAGYIKSHWD